MTRVHEAGRRQLTELERGRLLTLNVFAPCG